MRLNPIQENPDFGKAFAEYLRRMRQENENRLLNAFKKMREDERKKKKNIPKKTGSVTLSNTDTVNMCAQLKAKLNAKISEIMASDLEEDVKMALVRSIIMEISKVDQKIAEIRRREAAVREERSARKNEKEHVKRKRKQDMEKRSVTIRKDYLYPASQGGLDPDSYGVNAFSGGGADFTPPAMLNIAGGAVPSAGVDISVSGGGAPAAAEVSIDTAV